MASATIAARSSGEPSDRPLAERLDEEARQRQRTREFGLERGGAPRLDKAIGVLALWQQDEAGALGVGYDRQGRLESATRGLATGRIAVEREDHVIGGAQQRADVGARDRSAECSDSFCETGLRQLDHIEIALADDGTVRLPDRIARLVQPVKLLALAEHWRLG